MSVEQAFKSGVLDEAVHNRFVQNIEQIAKAANVSVQALCVSAKAHCNEVELSYLKELRQQVQKGNYGIVFTGKPKKPINAKMIALTGACVRNFINARVMTVQSVLDDLRVDQMDHPTVLMIPNFFVTEDQGGSIPHWQISLLLGMLYDRQQKGLQTFLYVADLHALSHSYGALFGQHLEENFIVVPA